MASRSAAAAALLLKARSLTTQGPRAPVPQHSDGLLLRRRIALAADRDRLMALLDEKRIAHSFGSCVPIFQARNNQRGFWGR